MSEVNIDATQFTNRDCIKEIEPTVVSDGNIVKIPMHADKNDLVVTITPDAQDVEVTLKAKGIFTDKKITVHSGKVGVLRNFESAWYKHPDGCIHLEFAISGENTAKLTATEGD